MDLGVFTDIPNVYVSNFLYRAMLLFVKNQINSLYATDLFRYPLKTSENQLKMILKSKVYLKDDWKLLGSSIKYVHKIFVRTCAYQGVRNVSFSENFAHVLNVWSLPSVKVINLVQITKIRFVSSVKKTFWITLLSNNHLQIRIKGVMFRKQQQFLTLFPSSFHIWLPQRAAFEINNERTILAGTYKFTKFQIMSLYYLFHFKIQNITWCSNEFKTWFYWQFVGNRFICYD